MIEEARLVASWGPRTELYFTQFPGVEAAVSYAAERHVAAHELIFPLFLENWRYRRPLYLAALWGVASRWRRYRCDLVHVPFAWTQQGLTMMWLAACIAPKIVVSVHNVFPEWRPPEWHRKRLIGPFSKTIGVYGVSRAATESFTNVYGDWLAPGTCVRSVPNYVDGGRFYPSRERYSRIRERLQIPLDGVVVATIGRMSEQKRPIEMLDVLARLVADCPDVPMYLLWIGGGDLEGEFEGRAEEIGVSDRIRVTGFVNDPEEYIAAADIHALVSVREGFGIATIEAMASCVPAIAYDIPACREVLDGAAGGVLVPVDDKEAMVAAVERLVCNREERVSRGQVARQEVLERFGVDAWRRDMHSFYQEALEDCS